MGDAFDGGVVEIGLEYVEDDIGSLIERVQPARELPPPASRIPHPESREPHLPQLQVHWLRERYSEARVLPRRKRELGEGGERGSAQRRPHASGELGSEINVHARLARPRRPRQE